MGTIRFSLRIDKSLKSGQAPIELVYQISGQRKYFNTGLKLLPAFWDANHQLAIYLDRKAVKKLGPEINPHLIPTEAEVIELNQDLREIRSLVNLIERRFEMDRVVYSPTMVIDALKDRTGKLTKKDETSNLLFGFIEKYIQDHQNTREAGSLTVFKSLKNHLEGYQKTTKNKVTFENINYSFFQAFQNYLLSLIKVQKDGSVQKLLNNTTIAKQLSTIKTFLNYARKQGILVPDKYKDFKIKRDTLEVIALTNEEFEKLFNLDLTGDKKLSQVRDVFCFACSTGLRYSDLDQLRREHIKGEEIRITVKKTKEPLTIPLNPFSAAILQKYTEREKPLPVISNQKMNQYIKDLCQLAEINDPIEIVRFRGSQRESTVYPKYELIGVHTGRKTFATLSLERGMSAEEVMTITGHKDYKSFKRYVKVTEQRKKTVMRKAWGDIKPMNTLKKAE